ncbi:MAG: IclR family transcriptional regulator [Acidobacteriaceae bacterium]
MTDIERKSRRRKPKAGLIGVDKRSSSNGQYLSKAISRALDVLDSFREASGEQSLMEISKRTKLPESSLFRILMTLQNREYLVQLKDGSYRLAPKVLSGKYHERAGTIRDLLHPRLQSLARQFDETATSAFLFEDRIQVLETVESLRDIRATTRVGRVLPPYASALGKAITAFQDRETIDRLIEVYGLFKRTEYTVIDRAQIYREYEQIRATGVSFDRGEATEGGICIGIPIFSVPGKVETAISVSIPLVRHSKDFEKEIVATMQKISSELSAEHFLSLE